MLTERAGGVRCERAPAVRIVRLLAQHFFRLRQATLRFGWLAQSRAAEDHDGGTDAFVLLDQFGFEQLELQAHWPQLIAAQKIGVLVGSTVGGGLQQRFQEFVFF